MLRASFVMLLALAAGIIGYSATEATAFPGQINTALETEAAAQPIINVRASGGRGGYHGGHYNRPVYRHGYHPHYRPGYYNGYRGPHCRSWSNS